MAEACSITPLSDLRFYRSVKYSHFKTKSKVKSSVKNSANLCQSHSSIIRLNKPAVYNLPSYIINQCCEWLLPGIHLNYTYTRYHLIHSTYPIVSQGCSLTPVRERNIQRESEWVRGRTFLGYIIKHKSDPAIRSKKMLLLKTRFHLTCPRIGSDHGL